MRTIRKRQEPKELTEWTAANQAEPDVTGINFDYDALRQNDEAINAVLNALLAEQGQLCAYTGRRISPAAAHIEHLLPQALCERGYDVAYHNLIACWPAPNTPRCPYGAHAKDDWPSPEEMPQFVSPLSSGCGGRFHFNQRGEITHASDDDAAAKMTIAKLRLDHKSLTAMRQSDIDGVLGKTRTLSLKDARTRLKSIEDAEAQLDSGAAIALEPFCFALKQALQKYITALERIKKFGPKK